MDSQSDYAEGGRVTRSKSKSAKPPESRRNTNKPPPRYAESSSSLQNSGEGNSNSDAEFVETTHAPPSLLPERLFAPNRYPNKPRLNIYSKAKIIGTIAKSLAGTPELQCLLDSQFGGLFRLPVARCLNSVKLVHSLLSRQLVTLKKYELWFLFADNPLRFSLTKFRDITGLKCDPFGPQTARSDHLTLTGSEDEGEGVIGRMWRKLFGKEDPDVRVPEVLGMLADETLPVWKRLPLALIALVDGLVVCGHKHLRLTASYVEMLEDTRAFLQYSWGREAFLATMSRLLPPTAPTLKESLKIMRFRLQQKTAACYGFPLALQLMAFKAIPALIERIPEPDKMVNFLEEPDGCNSRNTLLAFEDIIEVEAAPEVAVSFSLPDEDLKWEDEREDPKVEKLVDLMRRGSKIKGTDFKGGDASLPPLTGSPKVTGLGDPEMRPEPKRRFGKRSVEAGCSSKPHARPSRPRRDVGKEPELFHTGGISEEVKTWFRVELTRQLGILRQEIYAWTHPNESCSDASGRRGTQPAGEPEGCGNDAAGYENQKRKRVGSGGDDAAEASERKKQRNDSGGDEERMTNNDSHRQVPMLFDVEEERDNFDEAPIGGLDLLASMSGYYEDGVGDVGTFEGGLDKEAEDFGQSKENSMALVLYVKPKAYVLPGEVCDSQVPHPPSDEKKEAPSPTNSEDYKTPPEHDLVSDYRTPDAVKVDKRRYLTRSAIRDGEGKSLMTSSNIVDQGRGKHIRKRSTKIGGVYTPDTRLKELFKSCTKPEYTPLCDVDVKTFKQFKKILLENPKQEFSIVTGSVVSNQLFLSLAKPTNWVNTEHIHVLTNMLCQRHGDTYLGKRCVLMDYYPLSCIIGRYKKFEEATDKLKFDWGGPTRCFVTWRTRRRNLKTELLRHIDRVYVPMLWGNDHWVGLVIELHSRRVEILDCNIPHKSSDEAVVEHMTPLLRSMPYVLAAYLPPSLCPPPEEGSSFTWVRPGNIYFNERSGDCGPCAVKFLEMHAAGCTYHDMAQITDEMVNRFREKYAMDTYEEFIGSAEVFNRD